MTGRLRLPEGVERPVLAAAAVCWAATLGGWWLAAAGLGLAATVAVIGWVRGGAARVIGIVALCGALSGAAAAARAERTWSASVPEGRVQVVARVLEDPVPGRFGGEVFPVRPVALATNATATRWDGPALAVESDASPDVQAGDLIAVAGRLRPRSMMLRGDPVAGTLRAGDVEVVRRAAGVLFGPGNAIRRRVRSVFENGGGGGVDALLSGFLIGDVAALPPEDAEALRRAGLTHFVAVSGSNVALFLVGWWILTAPISRYPRLRSGAGLIGLALFVVVTRWEPSVLRASAMAALVLAARLFGRVLTVWTALGAGIVVLLVAAGDLAVSIGFQLSAAATAGVIAVAGATVRRPRWLFGALEATVGAQLAVLPLLLVHFGTVPLAAPVANLLAAPLVVGATALAGVGVVIAAEPLLDGARLAASGVLAIARMAAEWPQLGPGGVVATGAVLGLARLRTARPVVALIGAVGLAAGLAGGGGGRVVGPSVTALDVGQGDAIVVRDAAGTTVLVDGGRDPAVLRAALRRQGVEQIDLLVITHGDADHVGGLQGIGGLHPIGAVWWSTQPDQGDLVEEVVGELERAGATIVRVRAGMHAAAGSMVIEVAGPLRRYASDNDASVVLLVHAGVGTVLLPGDIEALGQRELSVPTPDVMIVPHHGSSTSDLAWLARVAPPVAIVSVGPNTYGHPDPAVLATLREAGSLVLLTSEEGDVTVPLAP